MEIIRKVKRSFFYASRGIFHAFRVDKSFRLEILFGLPFYFIVGYVLSPLQPWELTVLVGSYLAILVVELENTAFERMLNKIHPEQHKEIGESKDIAAAGVLVTIFFAFLVIVLLVMLRHTGKEIPNIISHPFV